MPTFLLLFLQGFVAFFLGTVVNDFFHYFFHYALRSENPLLHRIGKIHIAHHLFYSRSLQINKKWLKKNLFHHVLPEYCITTFTILVCLVFFDYRAILGAIIFETLIFVRTWSSHGIDTHHRPLTKLLSARGGFFVSREYHALHHIYPTRYYSSVIKLVDYLFGTAQSLAGKKIVMTGANGALGSHMKNLLEKEGAILTTLKFGIDYTYENYAAFNDPLSKADILFLCHGSKYKNAEQANCDSFVEIIELFKKVGKRKTAPLEIWAVGSEIECHPSFGLKKLKVYSKSKRKFARFARIYFHDREIQYRHLVHSAFCSRMGPGLMSARFAARMTLFLIKRDFKYVPVTYTGIAWINYFKFIF